MEKKGQAQIITTVLIILLVLASIVIVWQLVNSAVGGAANEAQNKMECSGISLIIKSVDATSGKVIVERKVGGTESKIDVMVRVGTSSLVALDSGQLGILEQGNYTLTGGFTAGTEIAIAPKVNGIQCDIVDTEIV